MTQILGNNNTQELQILMGAHKDIYWPTEMFV